MTDVPAHDQMEPMQLQQRTRTTALVFAAHPKLHEFHWSFPSSINNMHTFKALQRQPFHRTKRKLHPALTAVITRLQFRDSSQDGNHFLMSQSPAQLWEHGHMLTEYQVWVCYRAATHQLNLYFPGCERDSTYKRHLACTGHHEGLLHILWDCVGTSKMWAYIITQWTRTEISPAQMVLYKQAALSRSAPELPPSVREIIKQVFPDHADIAGQAWKRIWWIACSVCVTTLWTQRNRNIHKQKVRPRSKR